MPNLRILDLKNNHIAFISLDAFEGLGKLEKLDISSNWLGNLHPDSFAPLPTGLKEQILLHENPLQCDCEIRHLVSWVTRWPKRIHNEHLISCAHTQGEANKNAGRQLVSLKSHDLCDWLAELRNMIIIPISILLTICTSVFITCFCRRKSTNGSTATMSTIYRSNFYDVDSIGNFSAGDHAQPTVGPFQYPRKIQLPASLVPMETPPQPKRKLQELKRIDSIDEEHFADEQSEQSYEARSEDSRSFKSYYSSDSNSEYDSVSAYSDHRKTSRR